MIIRAKHSQKCRDDEYNRAFSLFRRAYKILKSLVLNYLAETPRDYFASIFNLIFASFFTIDDICVLITAFK